MSQETVAQGNISFSNHDLGGIRTCSDFKNSQYLLATGSEYCDSLIKHTGGSGPDWVEETAALESSHHIIGEEWLHGCLLINVRKASSNGCIKILT